MLKPLTLSLSLAFALALSATSLASGLHHGVAPSAQEPVVSAQCPAPTPQCGPVCEPKTCKFSMPKICLPKLDLHSKMQGLGCSLKTTGHNLSCGIGDLCKKLKPKPPCYTYEWVLKKKRVHGGCGAAGCDTCGGPAPVYPTSQVAPAPQGPAVAPAPQAYGSGQATVGAMLPAPAPVAGDEAPPAPEVAPAAPAGPTSSLLFSTPSGN